MISIRTILCPVDFTPATARQVELAFDLCQAFKARLVLHHNLSAVSIGAGVGWMWAADHRPMSEETVQLHLSALAESRPGIEVDTTITRGPVSASVLAVSEEVAADLVVLSAHKMPPEEPNSVAELILGAAERSVLALHDDGVDRQALNVNAAADRRQVTLVPTDLTPESRAAVNFAFELAHTLPLDIHLLHLLGQRHKIGHYRADAERRLQALIPPDCADRTSVHIRVGDPVEGILEAAGELSAACVVMGEHTRAPLRRWFSRDTSRAVLHTAPCPVWYVPGTRAA